MTWRELYVVFIAILNKMFFKKRKQKQKKKQRMTF